MSTQSTEKKPLFRWTARKGLLALVMFLIISIVAEYLIVLYAMDLGTQDQSVLEGSFAFPGTASSVTLMVSPLFHLVPITVIIALAFCWLYITKTLSTRPQATWRGRASPPARQAKTSRLHRVIYGSRSKTAGNKTLIRLSNRMHLSSATVRSAFMIFLIFVAFIVLISSLLYPQLIYRAISTAYQSNPSLLNFIRETGRAFAFLGSIGGGLTFALPGIRDFFNSVGASAAPLANLDGASKYLIFQNLAAWLAAILASLYVMLRGRGTGYRRIRRT